MSHLLLQLGALQPLSFRGLERLDKNNLLFHLIHENRGVCVWGGWFGETLFIMERIDTFITRAGEKDGETNS